MFTGIPDLGRFGRYLDYARLLPQRLPYAIRRFFAVPVQRVLAECIPQREFDVAICDFLASAPNFPDKLPTPTLLFQHNVESVLWRRRALFERKWLNRLVANIECAKMTRYEAKQLRRFHHVLAVSDQDRHTMSSTVDLSRISVVPTGVDLGEYCYDPQLQPTDPLVVFVGSMDWEPNIDGVEYFCKDIWPLVLAAIPNARFRIVGRDPNPRVKKLANSTVEVTGSVPSVKHHLREAAVLVVPLRIGSGTRIKIYEGMAMGKATVSTSVGAEGLDVHHGSDILIQDEPRQFATAIVTLLHNPALRHRYEAAAAATASQYDWSIVAHHFTEILKKTIESAGNNSTNPDPAVMN